jgi:hypothetical protein
MEYKTINIEGQEYYLVPKPETKTDSKVLIEPVNIRTKKIIYVKTRYMWGKDYDKKLVDGGREDGGWMTYQREEWDDGSFEWVRTFGGYVTANDEDRLILESWYQSTFLKNQ